MQRIVICYFCYCWPRDALFSVITQQAVVISYRRFGTTYRVASSGFISEEFPKFVTLSGQINVFETGITLPGRAEESPAVTTPCRLLLRNVRELSWQVIWSLVSVVKPILLLTAHTKWMFLKQVCVREIKQDYMQSKQDTEWAEHHQWQIRIFVRYIIYYLLAQVDE